MIKAVVCDFGGVLTSPLREAFGAWHAKHDVPFEALVGAMETLTERDGVSPLWELECGRMTEADFFADLGEVMSHALGRPVDTSDFTETYFAHLQPNTVLIDRLADVRDAGVRLAMLTNNVKEWRPYWTAMLPVDELFEIVVDSADVGMRKPDARIYELTCERLGLPPSACAFVDDFEHNCVAAREVGLHPVWYRDDAHAAIAELEALLSRRS